SGTFSLEKAYKLKDLPDSTTMNGIEFDAYLFNTRTLRSYDTSLIIPIRENMRGTGIGHIGRRPFVIDLSMRTEGNGATFDPFSTELYIEGDDEAILPSKILRDRRNNIACAYSDMPKNVGVEVTEEPVPIFNKNRVLTKSGIENKDWNVPHWTCIQFRFDVPTPDPSKKFRLKLGAIVKPNGEHIRPTIYFVPVTYKSYTH
ncbi:hypothetical protein MNBD_GAMMA13-2170, partial [hydrothermal vent metagenome]